MRKAVACIAVLSAAAILVVVRPLAPLRAQQPPVMHSPAPWDPSATRVVIRYGVTDTEAGNWKGRIEGASAGARSGSSVARKHGSV